MNKEPAPGAAPELQGYFARSWEEPREPPTWHHGHSSREWIKRWLAGWDECNRFKQGLISERKAQENPSKVNN